MSNSLAIAAVTATLRQLLDTGLSTEVPGTSVTCKPLDTVGSGSGTTATRNQVNLFLYQTQLNPALRNMDFPLQGKSGETASPPLALDLYYLLTAYGAGDDEAQPFSHRLLGRAMRILHDHAVLGRAEIRDAFPGNDLHQQIERLRITPQPLSLDELSKLWTMFQTHYRISTAYQVSVVLIDSVRPPRRPLPVLRRGPQDQGVNIVLGPFPTLDTVAPPAPFWSARLGDELTLTGANLSGAEIEVVLQHPRVTVERRQPLKPGATDSRLQVSLPNDVSAQTQWAAGFYTVTVQLQKQSGEPVRTTNALSLPLAPRLTNTPLGSVTITGGTAELSLQVSPQVLPEQSVSLLLGEREIAPELHATQTATLTFRVRNAMAGEYVVRLRVDGVDSQPYEMASGVLAFDPAQKVRFV